MHYAKCCVAVSERVGDDSNCDEIVDFVELATRSLVALQLVVRAVEVFYPTIDFTLNSCFVEWAFDRLDGGFGIYLAFCAFSTDQSRDRLVLTRHEVAKRLVF